MNADLQRDEAIIPRMLDLLADPGCARVVGTRRAAGGGTGSRGPARRAISSAAARIAQPATPTRLSDPMSGFFAIRRAAFLRCARHPSGLGGAFVAAVFNF